MSMKMMNAAYLVDNAALLSLQEKQDGVEFHCFDMDAHDALQPWHTDRADRRASKDAKKSDGQRQKPAQVDGLAACKTGRDDGCRI